MTETKSVKALKKQLAAAIAMVCVAAIALGSSTYAWFVSNNRVTATTTNISAQSNSAYLVIDTQATSTTSTNTSSAASTIKTIGDDDKLYPAQWKNSFDSTGKQSGESGVGALIYQFESAYATDKTKPDEKTGTRFLVGSPTSAVSKDYTVENTFYVGTGTYDGEFSKLKVSNMTVTDTNENHLGKAMRVLIEAYKPNKDAQSGTISYGSTPASWVVVKYNDGNIATIESQSIDYSSDNTLEGVVYQSQFGKSEGDVMLKMYIYYDGSDDAVYTTNLDQLTVCGTTITLDATPVEHK